MSTLNQRQLALLKRITGRLSVPVHELLEHFEISRETLRKELMELESLGLISRGHGKVSYKENEINTRLLEASGLLSKAKRREEILKLLRENKEVRISNLSSRLHVSAITIRHDISALEMEGIVIKKHGVAALLDSSTTLRSANRDDGFSEKAQILGKHTLMHIHPGESVFLDGGEVSRFVAASIPPYTNIPIVTNSMAIIDILRSRSYPYTVQMLPGILNPESGTIHISVNDENLSHIKIDKAFINPSSFAKQTCFLNAHEDPLTIERICDKAERVYLILDADFLDVIGKKPFLYKRFRSKIQEVVIDDGIGRARADLLFSRRDPLVICGKDYAYRNVSRQQHRVGFLVNKDRNYFVQAVHNSLLEANSSYSSVSLVIRECEGNYQSTVSNLNILLQDNVDLIIDFSLCQESSMYAGERCRSRNVPLISVDFVAPGAVYFGADNARAGAIAGEKAQRYIENCWDGRLEHLVVLGKHGYDPVTRLRISGALEHIEQSIDFKAEKVDTIEWGNPERNPTQDLVTRLKQIPKTENMLIMAFNLRHLLAAYDYIIQYRNPSNTIIVGQNYTKQIEELMKTGNSPIIGCVHYNPQDYGKRIMDLSMRILDGMAVDPLNYTQLSWISREEVQAVKR